MLRKARLDTACFFQDLFGWRATQNCIFELAIVQREAVERLGMVFPAAGQVVVVRPVGGPPVA